MTGIRIPDSNLFILAFTVDAVDTATRVFLLSIGEFGSFDE